MKKFTLSSFAVSSCISLLVLSVLALGGCSRSEPAPPPPQQQESPVPPGATTVEGHVEPLVPSTEKPAEAPKEGAAMVPATLFGKIAAEAVPMPPVEDLIGQIDEYVEKIGKNLDDMDGTINYKNDADTVVRDANGLALVALSVGMAAADSKYKKAAPALIKSAMALAAVEKYDDAKKAFAELKASLASQGDPATLQWTKVAELPPVMKAVPNLSSTLTRLTNTERKLKRQLERSPERVYGAIAALAAITQGSIANAKDTQKPDAADDWKKECEQFRDMAIKANAAAHGYADGKVDYAGYWEAFKAMTDSCDKCHEKFYPGAIGKNADE